MMQLEPWQQRLITERAELVPKLDKLSAYLEDATNVIVPADRELMLEQRRAMSAYANTLKHRIERFQRTV